MRAFWILYQREVGSYFVSPIAYLVLLASALMIGVGFSMVLAFFQELAVTEFTVLQALATSFFLWIPLMIQVPLLTMRSFSEEFKLGTIEMILTAPVRDWELVLAKFFGALTFFIILWIPLLIDLMILYFLSDNHVPLIGSSTATTFLLLLLIGSFYISIGIFTSSMTSNQIIAAVLCFSFIFAIFSIGFLPFLHFSPEMQNIFTYFSATDQMETFSKGILDTRPIVFYISSTLLVLFLTQRVLQAQRHRA